MNKQDIKLIRKFLKYLFPYRTRMLFLVLSGLAGMGCALVNPYLVKIIVDKGIIEKDLNAFIIFIAFGSAVFVCSLIVQFVGSYMERYINIKIGFDISRDAFRSLGVLPLKYFNASIGGENLYKIENDVSRVKEFIANLPQDILVLFPRLLFTLTIVFFLNWKLAVLSIIFTPFLYLPSYIYSRKMSKVYEAYIKRCENIFGFLGELFSNIIVVKVFGREKQETEKYLGKLGNSTVLSLENARLEASGMLFGSTVNKAAFGLIALFGGYQVIKGDMSLGSLTAIMVYFSQLISMQSQVGWFFKRLSLELISCRRLDEILSSDTKPDDKRNEKIKRIQLKTADIVFRDIYFGYRDTDVLQGISFSIKASSMTALTGKSGCGKSTIINLLLGLYEVNRGEITIGGISMEDIDMEEFRQQVGVALQEPYLWNDTVENNIKYARPNATEEEFMESVRICGIDIMVNCLPDGYKTVIGENACRISEGQKQRIALARAIINKPELLILDEAMSSLDSESEDTITRRIRDFLPDSTIIVISHRFSAIKNLDFVVFLNGCDSVISGDISQLLNNEKNFSELFKKQV